MELQKAVMRAWKSIHPSLELVVFTDSEYWKNQATKLGITWTDEFYTNPNGTPFLTSMTDWIQSHYVSQYYGFINADILVHSNLYDLLIYITKEIVSSHILIVGRRYNSYVVEDDLIALRSREDFDQFIASETYLSEQFIPVAQDFFFFTEHSLPGNQLLPVVIGRNRYDNYLLTVCKEDPECTLVDVSDSRR